jgi:hypothetical protein
MGDFSAEQKCDTKMVSGYLFEALKHMQFLVSHENIFPIQE